MADGTIGMAGAWIAAGGPEQLRHTALGAGKRRIPADGINSLLEYSILPIQTVLPALRSKPAAQARERHDGNARRNR
jgi:hypothetical protein